MSKAPYPLFDPPEFVRNIPRDTWERAQAKSYFEWFVGQIDHRIELLLQFFGERITDDRPRLLKSLGQSTLELLRGPDYWYHLVIPEDRERRIPGFSGMEFTGYGYSVVADLGVLLGKWAIEDRYPVLHWMLVTKPRRDADYNQPVIAGNSKGPRYNPVAHAGVAIARELRRESPDAGYLVVLYEKMLQFADEYMIQR